jgi:L-ascorbate metabolism protein UlaG (beta-lactamase superfamily)
MMIRNVDRGDHFDGRRFFNPDGPALQPFSKVPKLLLQSRTRWPEQVAVVPAVPPSLDGSTAVVTFVGHSTFLIQTPAGNILTDPMYSERAGPWNLLGPRRVRPPAVTLDDLPPVSIVLLSHGHYDHLDLQTLRALARRFDPLVIAPLGHDAIVRSAGIRNVETLDWWDGSKRAPLAVTMTPAHHFTARTPFDRNRALWGGFVVGAGNRRIYFAGDTAYVPFFADIRERLGPIDLALLPIGAYEPRWFMRSVHMNPAEAVQAHLDLDAAQSIGMHFGTFQLTTEGIDDPVNALAGTLRERNVPASRFRAIGFGESVRVA